MQRGDITALVLAGGQATRMGGVDKGLQTLSGVPLALHALSRLQSAKNPLIAAYAVNANRHLDVYEAWGQPVWPDTLPDQPGPLAGMLTGLRQCTTRYLMTVPCDAPRFPVDIVERLAQAFQEAAEAEIALATAPDERGILRRQPVFALMQVKLADHLEQYIRSGGRKVGQWMGLHRTVEASFNRPSDDPAAFANINTLESLRAIEARSGHVSP
nr:molybdenum cofactor guanylyltransferase MobA [Hydrogenophaga crassostreae]